MIFSRSFRCRCRRRPVAAGRDVLQIEGVAGNRLDYQHFSVMMSRSRKVAMFVAVNIDGKASKSIQRENDVWSLDGRIPIEAQIGEDLYSANDLDRGHLVRREDPNWGTWKKPGSPTRTRSISPIARRKWPPSTSVLEQYVICRCCRRGHRIRQRRLRAARPGPLPLPRLARRPDRGHRVERPARQRGRLTRWRRVRSAPITSRSRASSGSRRSPAGT